MTSKNLFSKLMKEDLKSRLWAIALISLGMFFMYPVVAAFMAGEINDYLNYEEGLRYYRRNMLEWLSFKNVGTAFIIMITAVVCGLSSFSYLNARSKVDFYHSIPVKREKFYLANYLNGILIPAVPYALFLLTAAIIAMMNGVDGAELWPLVLSGFALNMIYYIMMYSVVVIAAMLTGNVVIGFLGTMVICFIVPICNGLIQGYFGSFFETYYYHEDSLFEQLYRLSPVMEYSYQYIASHNDEVMWGTALMDLIIGLILGGIGCFLYRKRPSEAAGKAMAFAVSKPLVRIPIVITSALGLGLFFWGMRSNIGWAVFGLIFGAIVSHCVIEVIYNFDFRKLFSNKLQLIGCITAAMAVMFVFRYDLFGYDSYIPKAADVRHAAVQMNALSGWTSYGYTEKMPDGAFVWNQQDASDYIHENMEYQDIDNLLEIAEQGVANAQEERRERMNRSSRREQVEVTEPAMSDDGEAVKTAMFVTEEHDFRSYFTICYTLNSGRKVYRRYNGNLEAVIDHVDKMIQDEQFQKGAFPITKCNADEVAGIRFREQNEDIVLRDMTEEEKNTLLNVYLEEFRSLTVECMKAEYPVGLIRFTKEIDEDAIAWSKMTDMLRRWDEYQYYRGSDFESRDYYPVYPSFTKTLEILQGKGVEIGKHIDEMEIERMVIHYYYPDKQDDLEVIIKDPQELEILKDVMILGRRTYYNNVFQSDNIYGQISVIGEDGINIEDVRFPRNQVPEFVIERLKEKV